MKNTSLAQRAKTTIAVGETHGTAAMTSTHDTQTKKNLIMHQYFIISQYIYHYRQKEHHDHGHRTHLTNQFKTIIAAKFGLTFSITKIKYLQKLFTFFPFGVTPPNNQLTWCHYTELLKTHDPEEARFYLQMAVEENLSVRKIRHLMKSQLYYKVATTAHILAQSQ